MKALILFFVSLGVAYYVYFLIFKIKESIIAALYKLFIYEDGNFLNISKYLDGFQYFVSPDFVRYRTTLYAVQKNFMIFAVPVIVGILLDIVARGSGEVMLSAIAYLYTLAVVILFGHTCFKWWYKRVALKKKDILQPSLQ